MRVLLVDDEPLIVEGLQRLIKWEEIGCEVIGTALDGNEALARYSELPCDLVITDICMHQCDGLELIRQWKNIQPSTRWVVLSGFQDFEYVQSGLKLGIENYLLKPVDDRELVATIAQVKRKREHEQKEQVAALILRDNAIWRYLTGEMGRQQYEERMQLYRQRQSSFLGSYMYLRFQPSPTWTIKPSSVFNSKQKRSLLQVFAAGHRKMIFASDKHSSDRENHRFNHCSSRRPVRGSFSACERRVGTQKLVPVNENIGCRLCI